MAEMQDFVASLLAQCEWRMKTLAESARIRRRLNQLRRHPGLHSPAVRAEASGFRYQLLGLEVELQARGYKPRKTPQ